MKFFAILLALAGMFFLWVRAPQSVLSRINVLVGTSPVSVWSWDKKQNTFTVLVIPSDYVVNGTDGYGKYSLDALWKLGFIDGKSGTVLTKSLEQTLAIPIPFYVGEKLDALVFSSDVIDTGKKLFSPYIVGRNTTNMPIWKYIFFTWALRRARLDAIRVIDLSEKSVIIPEDLPDGTKRPVLDAGRLDAVLKGVYEDELLASEGTTVAVYNTTTTPSLGTQAARMLTNLGIRVVAVGNASPSRASCSLSGTRLATDTKTAAVIKALFSCDILVNMQQERADLTIHLGSD